MTGWRSVLSLLLACGVLTGCTPRGPAPQDPGGSNAAGTPPTPTRASQPSGAFTLPSVDALPHKAVDVQLVMADDRYSRLGAWSEVGDTYMTMANPAAPAEKGDEGTTFVRVADRKTVATYVRSAPERRLYRVFFWRDTAIVQETTDINAGDEGGRIHLTRYDLTTGARTPLLPADSRRLGYLGAAALSGDRFAVAIEKDGQKDRCLHVFDLATGSETDAACLPPGPNRIFSVRGSDSGFTYLITAGETLESCRTAYWLPANPGGNGGPHLIGGNRSCHVFDHARHGDWDIWSEIPEAADRENNHTAAVLKATNGLQTVLLGVIDTSSTCSCGGHVYWRRYDPDDYHRTQIVRWKPGAAEAEIIYQANTDPDGEQWNLTFPGCSQNVMTIVRYRPGPNPPAAREVRYLPNA